MVKKKGQGYRSDKDGIPWGRTRIVSREGRISVPSPIETAGNSYEAVKTKRALIYAISGARVVGEANIQAWKEIRDIAIEKLNIIELSKKDENKIKKKSSF